MLSLRQRIFIIIGVISGIFIAIMLFIWFRYTSLEEETQVADTQTVTTQTNQNTTSLSGSSSVVPSNTNAVTAPPLLPQELYAKQLAGIFVERFMSYSNQNENQHIEDIQDMITPKMKSWVESQSLAQNTLYEGVTTRVISSHVTEFIEDEKATISIGVQQTISHETTTSTQLEQTTIQKSADVDVIKIGDEWKIDGLWWKDN